MLLVTNIPAIIYSKLYDRINYIRCSVGSVNLTIRTEMYGYIEKINICIGSHATAIENYDISLTDFRYKCMEAYPQHQVAIDMPTRFDIESLLRILYRDIDDILANCAIRDMDFLTIYKDVPLDCSKLNALVFQFLTADKIMQVIDEINRRNQEREAKIRKWYIKEDTAEGETLSVIDLTLDELKIVKRFCDAEIVSDSYGGTDYIYDEYSFRTKDEAIAAIKESITCGCTIDSILKKIQHTNRIQE